MNRLLQYERAGLQPPPVVFTSDPHGPPDLLDEPMHLSLADQSKLGFEYGPNDAESEHLQMQLRMALEKIHSNAGHTMPIGAAAAHDTKPLDGMDEMSSAMLVELAATVMPQQPVAVGATHRYNGAQRKTAISKWLAKRRRRHLTSQTKYKKMKDVAVSKARCKGGKFVKKSEREKQEGAQAGVEEVVRAMEKVKEQAVTRTDSPATVAALNFGIDQLQPSKGDATWQAMYAFYAQSEE